MKFSEAMKLLEEGKKVRQPIWNNKNYYIYQNKDGRIENNDGDICISIVWKINEDWEEYITDTQDIEELTNGDTENKSFVDIVSLLGAKVNEIIRVVNNINKRLEK